MIKAIEIKNFKSAEKLNLKFGRINTFIGENGSGKSTVLEALAFAVAAENDRLESEFLENRGIRITSPEFMRSCFNDESVDNPIEIKLFLNDEGSTARNYIFENKNEFFSEWKIVKDTIVNSSPDESVSSKDYYSIKARIKAFNKLLSRDEFSKILNSDNSELKASVEHLKNEEFLKEIDDAEELIKELESTVTEGMEPLNNFAIYSPENKQLRNLKEEGALRPIGIQGQGLFKLLRQIHKEQPDAMRDIEKGLKLIGWYESMDLDNEPELIEDELFIKDRYLPMSFTQRSANEGFLYMLFYMALLVSKVTPRIFAIDNIDAALNPKLCTKLMTYIVELAEKYDKQVFLTTHNPAILDGINLFDEQQKLFVVSRKKRGQTSVREFKSSQMPTTHNIAKKFDTKNEEYLMLSEAMIRGYIGGIPKGF
ncbi:AAA family ATPase [Aliivibrio fischeri]|uniref:AAA family ATPase n=1 Tax=Aliivibrio fischeri TaxID=668 RepID=UPI0018C725E7|nr:ATP-binding protein [Aliivibrio fischeri]